MKHKSASITYTQDRLLISGELNFSTVANLWNESLPLLKKCEQIHLDFSKVVSTNSAGLALLLEWIKYAERVNKPISLSHLPTPLKSIAAVAGIDKILAPY